MSIWDILGIEPTNDTSKIKKAYAQKLKIYHPEDDPEGFQKLKEAYDAAMKRAKVMKQENQVLYNTVSGKLDPTSDNSSHSNNSGHSSRKPHSGQTDYSSSDNQPNEIKHNEIKHDVTKPTETKNNETKGNELKLNDSPLETAQEDANEHDKSKPDKNQPDSAQSDRNQTHYEDPHSNQSDTEQLDTAQPDSGQSDSNQPLDEQTDSNTLNSNENLNDEDQYIEETYCNSTIETNEELIRCMEELYNDFPKRIDINNWMELMNSPILWKIGNKDSLSGAVLNFLREHPNLPWEILKILDEHFKFSIAYEYPNVDYDHSSIQYILRILEMGKGLSFSYLNDGSGYDVEKFLNLRQIAFMLMCQDKTKEAADYAIKAMGLYRRDLELLYILGYCHTFNENPVLALKALNTVLAVNPSHEGALYLRGKLHYEKGEYKDCIAFLLKIKEHPENYKDRILMLAKSYLQIRYYSSARPWFLKALEEHPSDLALKKLLLKTDELIMSRYNWKRLKKKLTEEDIIEHREVKAELKLFQKEGFRSGPVGKIAMMLVWGIVATFFIYIALARPIGSAGKPNKPPKAMMPAASTHALSHGEIEARLLNPDTFKNTDFGEVCYLKGLKKLKLRLNPTHIGFLPTENSEENISNKGSNDVVYLAEYNGRKIIIVVTKVESELPSQFTTAVGTIIQFNLSDSSNAINDALAAANLDASNLHKDMYITLLVPPSVFESLPQ